MGTQNGKSSVARDRMRHLRPPVTQRLSIDPDTAKEWLKGTKNRRVRQRHVDYLAKQMKAGHWRVTHQGIAFNTDGVLIDGQHRLLAIVESGVTVMMLVTHNLPCDSQLVMDIGARRSISDNVNLAYGMDITQKDAAIVRQVSASGQTYQPSMSEYAELFQQLAAALHFVKTRVGGGGHRTRTAPILAGFVAGFYYERDLEKLARCLDIVCNDAMPHNDDENAAHRLRIYAEKAQVRKHGERALLYYKTQNAINAYMNGRQVKSLTSRGNIYPWPLTSKSVRQACIV